MRKVLLLFVLFFITAKSYSIIFWQPYPITAVVGINGNLQRVECSVYDSLLGSWQYYNTPYFNDSILLSANPSSIIVFETVFSIQTVCCYSDSIYGFIIYDQELHQFMPKIKSHSDSDPFYNGAWLTVYDNTVRVIYSNSTPNGNTNDFIDLYIYNIISHSWSGGWIVSAYDLWDETCYLRQAAGGMSYTNWNDDWDDGPYYKCNFYDPVTSSFSSFYIGNQPYWSFSSIPIYDNQDAMAGEDWPWQNAYSGCFDPKLHGWSALSFGEVDIWAYNGIFINDGGLFYPTIGIYDDSLHHWALDTIRAGIWHPLVKDRVVTYYNYNKSKIYYEVFSPTSRTWVKDSSVTNGIDTVFIEEGTVHWTDTNSVSFIAGYNDTIGWGNYNTPLQLNFHITDLYNTTGYPLIYVRDYSIGSDSTWYTFGDGIETQPGLQHSLWHLFKVNGRYTTAPSTNEVCIHANTSAGLQTWCGNHPEPCSATIQTKTACSGICNGSATVVPLAGVAPITYLWSNGNTADHLDSLCAGDYSVTITDSTGCTVSNSLHISEMTVATFSSPIHCTGNCDGSISAYGTGGVAPYSFVWSTGDSISAISNLCAGNYSVTVTDSNQCTYNSIVNVAVVNPLALFSNTVYQPDCINNSNGYIEYSFSGGARPFTITVNQSIDVDTFTVNNHFTVGLFSWGGLPQGTYITTITDAYGCSITLTDTIVFNVPITTFSVTGVNPSCYGVCDGGFIPIIVGGIAPFQLHRCSGASLISGSLCAGSYCIQLEDSLGCSATTVLTVMNPSLLNSSAVSQNPLCIGCSNGYIVVNNSGGTPPYSLSWNPNNGFISGDTIYNLAAGVYSITVTDSNGCDKTVTKTLVDPPVSVFELSNDDAIVISPNPAKDEFTIYLYGLPLNNSTSQTVEIYNAIGEKIYIDSKVHTESITVNSEKFSHGIYFVILKTEHGDIIKKLVIE